MKKFAVALFTLVSFASLTGVAHAASQCEQFVNSAEGQALHDGSFELHLGSANTHANTADMDCMFLAQRNMCVSGDVAKAAAYLNRVASTIKSDTIREMFEITYNTDAGIAMSMTRRNNNHTPTETVMVGDEHGANPEVQPVRETSYCTDNGCVDTTPAAYGEWETIRFDVLRCDKQ